MAKHSQIPTKVVSTILDRLNFTKGRKVSGRPFHRSNEGINILLLIYGVGWKCCKPRVLTFDEFLDIPPCTTGKHSTVDDMQNPEPAQPPTNPENELPPQKSVPTPNGAQERASIPRLPRVPQPASSVTIPPPPESESDDASLPVPPDTTCRRRGCNVTSAAESTSAGRDKEECNYHPGQALFHEGSKGWTCCKRRVLEFDEFMKIEGCKQKKRHLFVGSGKKAGTEETLSDVRYDQN